MVKTIKLRKGLDINLRGKPSAELFEVPQADAYALMPDDFVGVTPKAVVKEEESVAAGQACLIYSPKDVICSFNLTNAHLNPVPDHSSSLIGAYQRLVIGPNLYKLADDGSSLGITVSDDAIVGPYRAYIKFDKMPETRAIYAPIEIKLKQIKY